MKSVVLTALLLVLISCESKTLEEKEGISEEQALSTIENFFTALGSADTLLMQQSLTHDFYMFEHDEVWTINELLELMPLTKGRKWSFKEVRFESAGHAGHITYFNQGVIPSDRSWLESALLINEDGSVKIKFLHSTKLYLK
ncbi:hypothetical protein [Roseivirga sp.]|uniref:hypothetical protein n=1 Tax=Roseivirga sp. TaxID=1964215 RepID=UPI003B517E9D